MDADRQQRLDQVAAVAVEIEKTLEFPAQMLIAQWALESGWGKRRAGDNGYFGVKNAARHTKCCEVLTREVFTQEQLDRWMQNHPGRVVRVLTKLPDGRLHVELVDKFADYNSLKEACEDYVWLITHGESYSAAWQAYQQDHDVLKLVRGVAKSYATDPNYAMLAVRIAKQTSVQQAIDQAKTALSV